MAEDRKRIGEHLIRKTRAIGYTVGTGFFGTGILNQMLTEQGAVEDAWKMMLQTAFPSWLYPVTQGATTIWEHWDSYTKEKGFGGQNAMNSFNHYSLGSVLSWLYHTGLGIQRDETKPGSAHSAETAAGPARVYERFRRQPVRRDFCRMGAERWQNRVSGYDSGQYNGNPV